jgi:hypothetical protein
MDFYELHHTPKLVFIEDISHNSANVNFSVSKKDQAIINDPTIFFRRTPPPDDQSVSTVRATSFTMHQLVTFPLTPAQD